MDTKKPHLTIAEQNPEVQSRPKGEVVQDGLPASTTRQYDNEEINYENRISENFEIENRRIYPGDCSVATENHPNYFLFRLASDFYKSPRRIRKGIQIAVSVWNSILTNKQQVFLFGPSSFAQAYLFDPNWNHDPEEVAKYGYEKGKKPWKDACQTPIYKQAIAVLRTRFNITIHETLPVTEEIIWKINPEAKPVLRSLGKEDSFDADLEAVYLYIVRRQISQIISSKNLSPEKMDEYLINLFTSTPFDLGLEELLKSLWNKTEKDQDRCGKVLGSKAQSFFSIGVDILKDDEEHLAYFKKACLKEIFTVEEIKKWTTELRLPLQSLVKHYL